MRCGCKLFACLTSTHKLFSGNLANKGCRLPLCFARAPPAALRLHVVEQACGCSAVRYEYKLFSCLASTRRSTLVNKGCRLPLCFALDPRSTPTSRASLWVLCGARQMQTVCLSGQHSKELLANQGCHLPVRFTLTSPAISDQSSKLVAALRCEAEMMQTVCMSEIKEGTSDNITSGKLFLLRPLRRRFCVHFCVHCFAYTFLRTLSDNITSGKLFLLRPLWRRFLRTLLRTLFCVHFFAYTF